LKKEILYSEGVEALEQAAQRSCGRPLPGSVPGQVVTGLWAVWSRRRCPCPWQGDQN